MHYHRNETSGCLKTNNCLNRKTSDIRQGAKTSQISVAKSRSEEIEEIGSFGKEQ